MNCVVIASHRIPAMSRPVESFNRLLGLLTREQTLQLLIDAVDQRAAGRTLQYLACQLLQDAAIELGILQGSLDRNFQRLTFQRAERQIDAKNSRLQWNLGHDRERFVKSDRTVGLNRHRAGIETQIAMINAAIDQPKIDFRVVNAQERLRLIVDRGQAAASLKNSWCSLTN